MTADDFGLTLLSRCEAYKPEPRRPTGRTWFTENDMDALHQGLAHTDTHSEPAVLLAMEEQSAMALLRLIAAAGLAVTVLGVALRLTA